MVQRMQFKVRLFLDGEYIEPSDYAKIQICSPTIDKIVNHIYDINHMDDQIDLEEFEPITAPVLQ